MYKVCDYLIQSQGARPGAPAAQLRPLDSRGGVDRRVLALHSAFGAAKIVLGCARDAWRECT